MAANFQLTGEVILIGADVKNVANSIRQGLSSLKIPLGLKLDGKMVGKVDSLSGAVGKLSTNLNALSVSATSASSAMAKFYSSWQAMASIQQKNVNVAVKTNNALSQTEKALKKNTRAAADFGESAALAFRRYSAFVVGSKVLFGFVSSLGDAVKDSIAFERQMASVSQVTGTSMRNLDGLSNTIKKLSVDYGIAKSELLGVSRTLAQAGISATDTKVALDALAKTSLAATFTDINNTTEGAIAIMSQFEIGVDRLAAVLGSVNKVAGQFAVESDDIIAAVRRTGGAFLMASNAADTGEVAFQKFIATFTAIRATTRESAESIASGLRTITTRIQRYRTIDFLKQFNINLEENGKFIGMYEALDKLGEGLKNIMKTGNDLRMIRIAEELGGYRQIGKLIPLLTETEKRHKALKAAQDGTNSLTEDQAVALKTLSVQLQQVREDFKNLVLEIVSTSSFKDFVSVIKSLSHSFIGLARSIEPIIPFLSMFAAAGLMKSTIRFGKSFSGKLMGYDTGGPTKKGLAMLHDREYVIKPQSAIKLGKGNLDYMNLTGRIPKFAKGGEYRTSGVTTTPMISIVEEFDIFTKNLHDSNLRLENEIKNGTYKQPMSQRIKDAFKSPMPYLLAAPLAAQAIGNETPGRAATGGGIQGGVLGGWAGGAAFGPAGLIAGATIGAATGARGAYVDKQVESATYSLEKSANKLVEEFNKLGKAASSNTNKLTKGFMDAGLDVTQKSLSNISQRTRDAGLIADLSANITNQTDSERLASAASRDIGLSRIMWNMGKSSVGMNTSDFNKDAMAAYVRQRADFSQGVRLDNEPLSKTAEQIVTERVKQGYTKSGRFKGALDITTAGEGNVGMRLALARKYATDNEQMGLLAASKTLKSAQDSGDKDAIKKATKDLDILSTNVLAVSKEFNEFLRLTVAANKFEQSMANATKGLRFFSEEFEKAGNRAEYIADTFAEIPRQNTAWMLGRAGGDYQSMGQLPNFNVFKNLAGAGMSDIQATLSEMPISDTMKNSVMASKVLGDKLPEILSEALSDNMGAGNVRSPQIIQEKLLADSRIKSLDPQILNKILKPIEDFFGASDAKGGADFSDIEKLGGDIQQGVLQASVQAASAIYEAMYKIKSEFLASVETISKMRAGIVMEAAKTERGFAEFGLKEASIFTGKTPTLTQGYSPFNTEANALLGAGLGRDVNMAHGVDSVAMAQKQMAALDEKAKNLRDRMNQGDVAGTAQELAKTGEQQQSLAEYMKLMKNDTSKLVVIENQMLQLENRRQAASSGIKNLAMSSPLERMKMIQQLTPLLKFQATGQMPTNPRDMQNMFMGADILKQWGMDPNKSSELDTQMNRGFLQQMGVDIDKLDPNGGIRAAAMPQGESPAAQALHAEWQNVISGMKAAADALKQIQTNTLNVAANNVVIQYNQQADAINKEIPKFGATQEAQRSVSVHEVEMKGSVEIVVHGMDFMSGLEGEFKRIANVMINQALNQHIDFNTGETKGGNNMRLPA